MKKPLPYEPVQPGQGVDTYYFRAAYRDRSDDSVSYEVFIESSMTSATYYAESLHPDKELLYVSNFPTATDAMTY